ncbi:MAG TPA: thiamine pyrophosphate-binding protein [Burkholderiales bacterium]|nr:thiamine pyrophosphate-binding protein [Burkholderiales bacterium]
MIGRLRGADILARALARAGVRRVFTLSGNHVMPVFDAAIDARLELIHVRHEAAAVHMADAWARLTGEVGVALVTGGPGHGNAIGALYTALAAESPVVLLSGHAPLGELGRGAFQEMRQADMAGPVCKAASTATSAAAIGDELARAFRTAKESRPGPVHLSLPTDALEAVADAGEWLVPHRDAFDVAAAPLGPSAAEATLVELARAERPVILIGPATMRGRAATAARQLERATGVPVIGMESPRGIGDPSLGAFADVLSRADLVLLLGKQLDFTLRFGRAPAFDAACRFIQIAPDLDAVQRASRAVGEQLILSTVADVSPAAAELAQLAAGGRRREAWLREVHEAVRFRPAEWASAPSRIGAIHPAALCRAVQKHLDATNAVFVCDGGEFGQWAQACLSAQYRAINGPAGSIGSALPFAAAAKLAFPAANVVALLGDGTFGFHAAEFDTAVRYDLPFVAVVGNDARWNAEHQIQLRAYGAKRAIGCELAPSRYDLVAAALGGHGEHVTREEDLPAALQRAFRSGQPACVNVMIDGLPAPELSRGDVR